MNAPSPAESKSAAPSPVSRLVEAALFTLLWVTLMQPLRLLSPSLDSSWQMMLGFAHDHGLQFGRELIPTVGPAGFLIMASPAVHHLGARLTWMLVGNAVLALVFVRLGRPLPLVRRAVYYAWLLLIVAPAPESMQGLALLILGITLLRPTLGASPWQSAAIAAALGVLALFKFTHLTLAVVVVASAALHGYVRGGGRRGGAILGGFLAAFLGGWLLLGQSLAGLPDFLRLSAEISGGYVDAMSVYEGPALFWLGLGCLAASAVYAWLYWRGEVDRLRTQATVIMLAAAWFLNWKHGFVRADGHSLTLFIACLLPAIAFPALTQEATSLAKRGVLAVVFVLALAGIREGYPPALTDSGATLRARLAENFSLLRELRHPAKLAAQAQADFTRFAEERRLPRISDLVGSASVDVLGTRQAAAMFDNFHYTPRPVFQDYYAFTPRLARLNEAFYASPRAPQFVLQQYESIDHRLPALDDARVRTLLLAHYALVTKENGWLLWEKHSAPARLAPAPLTSSIVAFGEAVPVPAPSDGILWAQVDVQPTLLGRLRALLYKPPQLALEVQDQAGATASYRMVRAMAADGWLLQPNLVTQEDVIGYFDGRDPAAVRTIRVVLPESDRKYFSPTIKVSFARLPAIPRQPASSGAPDPRYRMFNVTPVVVHSPHPAGPVVLEGREAFFVHAPGEIEFAPDIAVTRLHGSVGLMPGAYSGADKTDGVEIIIEHVSQTGRRTVLWHRMLDPAREPADRGLQPFAVNLPGKGRVFLKNLPGPRNEVSFDWTLWAGLVFD